MPSYRLVPDHAPERALEFEGIDPAAVLSVAIRHRIEEGHVYESDVYLFTLRHSLSAGGCWIVARRDELAAAADELH
jgi:hypothetical protein